MEVAIKNSLKEKLVWGSFLVFGVLFLSHTLYDLYSNGVITVRLKGKTDIILSGNNVWLGLLINGSLSLAFISLFLFYILRKLENQFALFFAILSLLLMLIFFVGFFSVLFIW
jgi:hypothetical protein